MAVRSHAPPDDWITVHRAVWARKPGLRMVYTRWFATLQQACEGRMPTIELGCGPGFFKECYPELIAVDAIVNPYADVLAAADALPFDAAQVGSIVLLDVFHHLPRPVEFLREAARVLRPGGRMAMIEPWMGLAGRVFYRWLHHEDCDLLVDPTRPWGRDRKAAMAGNAALPYLYLRPGGYLEGLGLPLKITRRQPFAALPWVLSGGFQPSGLPIQMVSAAEMVDCLLSVVPRLTALRCLVVMERVD